MAFPRRSGKLLAAALVAAVGILLTGCGDGSDDPTVVPGEQTEPLEQASPSEEQTTIRGEVTEVVGAGVFRLSHEGSSEGLLVFVLGDTETPVSEGQTVEVTGTPREVAEGVFEAMGADERREDFFAALQISDENEFVTRFSGQTTFAATQVDVVEAP